MHIGISLPVRELNDDLPAIRDFAQTAEELGFTHLRVPDQVLRPGSGPLHEPLTLLSWIAGMTTRIELVPSVIILPERQTALVAKQAAEIDVLSGGRLRFGVGVGANADEYRALGEDFHTRGQRCDEQLAVLRLLWMQESVDFEGRWHHITGAGLNPLPVQRPIPIWIGPGSGPDGLPADRVLKRVGRHADGWFAILPLAQFATAQAAIRGHAGNAGRDPAAIGAEAAVAVPGRAAAEWLGEVAAWEAAGASHLCLRTLGAGLDAAAHLQALRDARAVLDAR